MDREYGVVNLDKPSYYLEPRRFGGIAAHIAAQLAMSTGVSERFAEDIIVPYVNGVSVDGIAQDNRLRVGPLLSRMGEIERNVVELYIATKPIPEDDAKMIKLLDTPFISEPAE